MSLAALIISRIFGGVVSIFKVRFLLPSLASILCLLYNGTQVVRYMACRTRGIFISLGSCNPQQTTGFVTDKASSSEVACHCLL